MRDAFLKISSEFTSALDENYKGHPLANFIRTDAPKAIKNILPEKFKNYKTKGSCGLVDWANISGAWLAIFNPEITVGARKGYYVVYGFPAGTSEFVFGLSQGYTEAKATYKSKWEEAIEKSASLMQLKVPKEFSNGFKTGRPKFSLSDSSKDKGYRVGYSHHKIYNSNQLPPEEELKQDLIKMLNAYEAVFLNGGRNLDFKMEDTKVAKKKKFEEDEDEYQNPPPKKTHKKSPKSAKLTEKEKSQVKNKKTNVRPRNPDYGEEAKKNANYKCEISELHKTFKRRKDGNQFTEAHHLIPYEKYDYFADELNLCLDRAINIVSLCPNCHRKIHLGTKEDISDLLTILYKSRGKDLDNVYACDLDTLKSFYDTKTAVNS